MKWTFPKITVKKTETQQTDKISEEIQEFLEENDNVAKDIEAIDIYHAAESLLRKRFKGRETMLDDLIKEVIEKNYSRGKYS